jgi:hypothetical protein
MIDDWPRPRLCTEKGKFHYASRRRCEQPAVITHCLPWFHSTPCRSSSSQHSDQLEPRSSCWGGAMWRPCYFGPLRSLNGPVGQQFASRLGGQQVHVPGMHPLSQWNQVSPVSAVLTAFPLVESKPKLDGAKEFFCYFVFSTMLVLQSL